MFADGQCCGSAPKKTGSDHWEKPDPDLGSFISILNQIIKQIFYSLRILSLVWPLTRFMRKIVFAFFFFFSQYFFYHAVLLIRIRLEPFYFGQPDPDPFHEMDPGRKKNQSKSWKISTKIYQNHKNFIHVFKKLYLCSTDINIHPINNKTDNLYIYIFFLRIRIKMKRIRNTAFMFILSVQCRQEMCFVGSTSWLLNFLSKLLFFTTNRLQKYRLPPQKNIWQGTLLISKKLGGGGFFLGMGKLLFFVKTSQECIMYNLNTKIYIIESCRKYTLK